MNFPRPILLVFLAILSLHLASCSTQETPAKVKRIDEVIKKLMSERQIPGLTLAVVKDGKTILQRAYGWASIEEKTPAKVETIYPLASTSKIFTSVAVMRLLESGELTLDDRVDRLLQGLPAAWGEITVRHLLTHTSGLPDVCVKEDPMEFLGETRQKALRKAAAIPLSSRPGEKYQYIQTGYILLGMILEHRSGKAFPAVMMDQLFMPLSMNSTRYGDTGQGVAGQASHYTMIRPDRDGKWMRLGRPEPIAVAWPDYQYPGAGLNSTVGDLARWDAALEPGRLLKSSSLETMWTATEESRVVQGVAFGTGCGWLIGEESGHKWVGQVGGDSAAFFRFPEDHLTVIVLDNCRGSDVFSIAQEVAKIYIQDR
jgi:D-alanyl-D-alanine carboxypeptidase